MEGSRSVDTWRVSGMFIGLLVWGLFAPMPALGVAAVYVVLALVAGILTGRRSEWTRHGLAVAAVSAVLTIVEWVIS